MNQIQFYCKVINYYIDPKNNPTNAINVTNFIGLY